MIDRQIYTPEPPRDAYGPDYITFHIREEFADLCRLIGFENARAEVAEIINHHAGGERRK